MIDSMLFERLYSKVNKSFFVKAANTIPYHKEKIYDRVKDFLYFFKIFERQEKYLFDYNEI